MIIPEKIDTDIIKNTVSKTGLLKSDVEDVFYFHWKSALEATKKYKSLEITSLFRMRMRDNKVKELKEKYESLVNFYTKELTSLTDGNKIRGTKLKLETATDYLNYINSKL
jgi:hypothetical protein